jgi:hypothetical protein
MCLTLNATCPRVPFIMWKTAMCAIHKMKHVHICLSLHDTYLIARCNAIIIVPVITFMHGIYNYVPETNHVSRLYSVAAVLYIQFMLHVMLFRP